MNTNTATRLAKWLASIMALAALGGSNSLPAQTWETVLNYQYVSDPFPGYSSGGGWGLATDALGNVFVGGTGFEASNVGHGLVLKTDTTATTWYVSDDFNPTPPYTISDVRGIGFDSNGNLYRSGQLWAPCTKSSCPGFVWHVRKSTDNGASWSTVESFQYAPAKSADPRGVAGDSSGNIFVCGDANDANGVNHWLVRKSATGESGTWSNSDDLSGAVGRGIAYVPGIGLFAVGFTERSKTMSNGWMVRRSVDGGATWSTVDLYQLPKQSGWYQDANALGVTGDAQGNIYVVGGIKSLVTSGRSSSAVAQWLIRRSTDGGAHWTTVDMFAYTAGQESSAWGISKDGAGSVAAVGRGHDSQGITHWIVRRPDALGFWQTVDDYQLALEKGASAGGVLTDAAGNLLVNGVAADASGVEHWSVRRPAATAP